MKEQAASRTMTLGLEQLPAFEIPATSQKLVPHLTHYLVTLLAKRRPTTTCLELPSVTELSIFFKCSHLELYDALRAFRAQGYDYQFNKLDTPLQVWQIASLEQSGKRRAL